MTMVVAASVGCGKRGGIGKRLTCDSVHEGSQGSGIVSKFDELGMPDSNVVLGGRGVEKAMVGRKKNAIV